MPVARLIGEVSPVELAEWHAYYKLEAEDREAAMRGARARQAAAGAKRSGRKR